MITLNDIKDFLGSHNYDLRISGNGRWIDQKCTPDVLWSVSDFVRDFAENHPGQAFNATSIWNSEYARQTIAETFSKPDTTEESAANEYDKVFSQPLCLLCYAGVLVDNGTGTRHKYTVQNADILEYISRNDTFSLRFLQEYIEKVLTDSGIMPLFEDFFNNQDKVHFKALKDSYENFIIANTKINGRTEVRRIYTKVLNPLAFKYNKKGTIHGSLSEQAISRSELMYNRDNFRDVYSGKPRGLSRRDWLVQNPQIDVREGYFLQMMNSAKRTLRNLNDEMRNSQSELTQFVEGFNDTERATQIHHIFPKNEFPEIMHYLENLIALTPNQHFGFAHPDNNTQVIDLQAQKILLIAKTSSIQYNLLSLEEETIYSFENFKVVLHIGWDDETVLEIADNDFTDIVHAICYHYATA